MNVDRQQDMATSFVHSPGFPSLPELEDYQSILASLNQDLDHTIGQTVKPGMDMDHPDPAPGQPQPYQDFELPSESAGLSASHHAAISAYLNSMQQVRSSNGSTHASSAASLSRSMPSTSAGQMAFSNYAQSSHGNALANGTNQAMLNLSDFQNLMTDPRTPQQFAMTNSSASSLLPDSSWDDQDTIFTPLLSPALTPLSSVMGSTFKPLANSSAPSSISHGAPSDFFSPLTSPALRPQPNPAQPNAALQRLIDQASLLGIMDGQSQAQAAAAFLQGQRHALHSLGLSHINSPEQFTHLIQQHLGQSQQAAIPRSSESSSSNSISGASGVDSPAYATSSVAQPASASSVPAKNINSTARSQKEAPKAGRGASRSSAKTRPSPIIRPTNTTRGSNTTALHGHTARKPSITSISPAVLVNPAKSAPSTAANSPAFPPSVFSSVGPSAMSAAASYLESPSPVDLSGNTAFNPVEPSFRSLSEDTIPLSLLPMSSQQPTSTDTNHSGRYSPMTPAVMMNLSNSLPAHAGESHGQNVDVAVEDDIASNANASTKGRARKPATTTRKSNEKPAKARAQRKSAQNARSAAALDGPDEDENCDDRKVSHKHAEQRRRDSLKQCFEELRHLLPHIPPEEDEEAPKRPGEGNVGGQRNGIIDPANPNKGVSKVALLRKSNEYIVKLHGRIQRRNTALSILRERLDSLGVVLEAHEMADLLLDDLDCSEQGSWPCLPSVDFERDSEEIDVVEDARSSNRTGRNGRR